MSKIAKVITKLIRGYGNKRKDAPFQIKLFTISIPKSVFCYTLKFPSKIAPFKLREARTNTVHNLSPADTNRFYVNRSNTEPKRNLTKEYCVLTYE